MLILGNIISFLGCLMMIVIGFVKKKERILTAQCVQFSLQAVANWILGGFAGALSGFISVARIAVFTRVKVTLWLKLGFLAGQAVLTVLLGAETLVEWLPFLSMVLYTWYLDTDNVILFKTVNMTGVVMWVFYDLLHRNYAAFAFDILTIISTVSGILLVLRDSRKKKEGIPCSE